MNRKDAVALTLSLGLLSGGAAMAGDPKVSPMPNEDRSAQKDGAAGYGKEQDHWAACAARDAMLGRSKDGVLRISLEDVREVQFMLVQKGYAISETDGTINDATEKALEAFQKSNGVKESGDIDIATLAKLGMGAAVLISNEVGGAELIKTELAKVRDGSTQFGQGAAGHSTAHSTGMGSTSGTGATTGTGSTTAKGASTGRSTESDKDRAPGTTEVPAGMPVDANVGGASGFPLGYVVLGKDQIESIQKRFKKDNIFSGETDGRITPEFIVSLRTFQSAKGVPARGVIDMKTLAAMGSDADVSVELTNKLDYDRADGTRGPRMKGASGSDRGDSSFPESDDRGAGDRSATSPTLPRTGGDKKP